MAITNPAAISKFYAGITAFMPIMSATAFRYYNQLDSTLEYGSSIKTFMPEWVENDFSQAMDDYVAFGHAYVQGF